MDLRDCRFYQGNYGLTFTVYSDQPCCARFRDRVVLPIDQQPVEIYQIEPGPKTRWVVMRVSLGFGLNDHVLRYFVRQGESYPERPRSELPAKTLGEIQRKLPRAA